MPEVLKAVGVEVDQSPLISSATDFCKSRFRFKAPALNHWIEELRLWRWADVMKLGFFRSFYRNLQFD
jgi:hypothetical protein